MKNIMTIIIIEEEREEPCIVYNCLLFGGGEERYILPISRCFVFLFSLFIFLVSCILDICRRANTLLANASPFALLVTFVFLLSPCLVLHLHLSLHLFLVSDFSLFSSFFWDIDHAYRHIYTISGRRTAWISGELFHIPMLGHCFLSDLFSLLSLS